MERLIVDFTLNFTPHGLSHEALADELERIANLVRKDYHSGEVVGGEEHPGRGWWNTLPAAEVEAVIPTKPQPQIMTDADWLRVGSAMAGADERWYGTREDAESHVTQAKIIIAAVDAFMGIMAEKVEGERIVGDQE